MLMTGVLIIHWTSIGMSCSIIAMVSMMKGNYSRFDDVYPMTMMCGTKEKRVFGTGDFILFHSFMLSCG